MTTQSWSTLVRHDSDAAFRTWGSEFSARLAAVGLIQTSDTGQINWTTVTRPGTTTDAGYEIWRLDDSQQGVAPIYLRFDYGTGTNAAGPRISVRVGTGSNGSGTLTGTALTGLRIAARGDTAQSTNTARQSYMVHVDGLFAFNWKIQGNPQAEGLFIVCRTSDASGSPSATGALVCWGSANSTVNNAGRQALRFASPAEAFAATTDHSRSAVCVHPLDPDNSAVGADIQALLCSTITPRVEPLAHICGVLPSEVTPGSTFTATMVGNTPRTFLAFSNGGSSTAGVFASANTTNARNFAVVWE